MPVLYFLLVVVVIVLGAAAVALYLAYIVCAGALAALCALAVYGAGLPIAYLVSLGEVLIVRSSSLAAPGWWPEPPENADPAVLQYFHGPARADAVHAAGVAQAHGRDLWRFGWRKARSCFGADLVVITAPLGAGAALGMAVGTALGVLAASACALVDCVTIAVSASCVRVAGFIVRGADSAVLRVKNIKMTCPHCHERIIYPSYECPSVACPRRHHDVRPGRFGILRRRCQCGEPMATLLLFGSSRMDAYCPNCGETLEHQPGKWPELILPFFGAVGAGKTRLLFSMATMLMLGNPKSLTAEFGDSSSAGQLNGADQIREAEKLLKPEIATDKTKAGKLPRAVVLRLKSGKSTRTLHMFDAAGEYFSSPERIQELRYLNKAATFILVIDPLSVEAFWDRLLPSQQPTLTLMRSTVLSPELAYQHTHQELEGMGIELRTARLAVVFSRADLIKRPDDDVASWATDELGLGNLVRSACLSFGEVRFFRTAAVIENKVLDKSIPALLDWALAVEGIASPGGSHD